MEKEEALAVVGRMEAIWPRRKEPMDGELREWYDFLRPLDGSIALRAVHELRDTARYRPSMAEFKEAYWRASESPEEHIQRLQLEGQVSSNADSELADLYGYDRDSWTYCWKCNMAIAVEDRYLVDALRGLQHPKCPPPGSAPTMPKSERLRREEALRRRGITA